MNKRRPTAPFYTVADDGRTLLSHGRYRTKFTVEDIPEWYCKLRRRGEYEYVRAKGVKHLLYKPNLFHNHMFKDDFLYISYDRPIRPRENAFRFTTFYIADNLLWGWNIVSFLKAADKYSDLDITGIKEEIEQKRVWFQKTYPDDYAREVGDRDIFSYN